jgi:HEAT repeat protein
MVKMPRARLAAALLLGACASSPDNPSVVVPYEDKVRETLEQEGNEEGQLIRRTYQNVRRHEELRVEGQAQARDAVRRTIAQTVDDNFLVFRNHALDAESSTLRNWAIACLGFAQEQRVAARKLLEGMLEDPVQPPWLLGNACLALSRLRDKETDLSRVIPMISHGDPEVRTSAANAIAEIWGVSATPRELTPQHYAAIDRLVGLLHDRATIRGRRAAATALANLHHPSVLDHLIAALDDDDTEVQIMALIGINRLGDARALDALFDYLDDGPPDVAATWAVHALETIAVENRFAQTRSELESLGTSGKAWRKWFRARRSQ